MDDIRFWLNGRRDYTTGVVLYLKHGSDPLLIRLFRDEAVSDFKKQKLAQALQQMLPAKAGSPAKIPIIPKIPVPAIPEIPTANRWSRQRDALEESLYQQWKPVYQEMMNLCARIGDVARAGLKDPNKEQEAGRMALRILELDDECDRLYYNRDHYKEHKTMPEEKKPVEMSLDPKLWPKKLTNHQRYVLKFKRDLVADPGNVKAAGLLQKHEWAVAEYKRLLNMA